MLICPQIYQIPVRYNSGLTDYRLHAMWWVSDAVKGGVHVAPVGDDAVLSETAQDFGAGSYQDAARCLEVDHVRRGIHHSECPAWLE